jgi:hypothetical protein
VLVHAVRFGVTGGGSTVGFRIDDVRLLAGGAASPAEPSFRWRGAWVATATYTANDLVTSGGALFVALQESLNRTPGSNTSHWARLTVHPGVETRTGAFTLALADVGKYLICDDDVTVPPNGDVPIPVNSEVYVRASATGVSIVAGSGVTLVTAETLNLAKVGAVVALKKVATNTWDVLGYTVAA